MDAALCGGKAKGDKMNATQIKTMTADECFRAIAKIECKANVAGRDQTASEKKTLVALDKRLDELMPEVDD